MTARIRTALTEELDLAEWDALTELCAAAFDEPHDAVWGSIGPGLHVIADLGGQAVAHAMIVDRALHLGPEAAATVDGGYVENVATRTEMRSRGYATAVMEAVGRILREEYAIGALSTRSHGFYARLGWERWVGPTYVRMPDGERVRSAADDGGVMVLRTPRTPPAINLADPIAVDWRAIAPW
jgi:aminoglycoside 2'-N-acetyltransferase I